MLPNIGGSSTDLEYGLLGFIFDRNLNSIFLHYLI